ncbi:hypothetical protein Val02_49200 [Virgisporangium aliadipatigenens]|uniref:(2Fe-2S) ferredoxin domain-containing protein n=1 Tax=Virgisporangium aliadipatigenens TaxID=741659 RepID=A0A8J3YM59_9ACTN|nr:hypothetical protein [Virgisporangium aliadipatigenens]GIJ48034.1 hypothetical protein Val02_49200 [Virgisporangium aliadipatigenens]
MTDAPPPDVPAVLVCRGCCCGTVAKHPDTDHEAHLARLHRAQEAGELTVRVTDCLNNCDNSNTVVVRPSTAGRRLGGRVTWFGEVLDTGLVEELVSWTAAGGPGAARLPARLADRRQEAPSDRTVAPGE